MAAGIVGALHVGKVPPALPFLRADLGVSGLTAAWVLSIFAVMGALISVPFGAFADRVGHRRLIVAAMACIAIASALGAASANVTWLLIARVVEGFGFLAMAVSIPPLIALRTTLRDRRLALGIWSAYMPIGVATAFFVSPLVLGTVGWRVVWLTAAFLAAASAVAVALVVSRAAPRAGARVPFVPSVRAVLAARSPLYAGLAFGAYTASYFAIAGFMPVILLAAGASVAGASAISAFAAIINGFGNIVGSIAARHVPRLAIMLVGAAGLGLGGAAFYLTTLPLPARIACVAAALFLGGMVPGIVAGTLTSISPAPHLIGTSQGVLQQCASIGQLIGPPLIAVAAAERGGAPGALVVIGLALIGITGATLLARSTRGRAAT